MVNVFGEKPGREEAATRASASLWAVGAKSFVRRSTSADAFPNDGLEWEDII